MHHGPLRFRWLLAATLLASACGIHPPPPKLEDKPVPAPALPESRVDVVVQVPLAGLKRLAEEQVPTSFGVADFNETINGGTDHCCDGHSGAGGVSAGWAVSRGPFEIVPAGSTIHVKVPIQYDLSGRARVPCCGVLCPSQCVSPPIYGSCGRNGEPRRRAVLGLSSTVELLPDWTLRSRTSGTATPIDRCQVTFAGIDITDRIIGAAQRVVDGASAKIDGFVASLAVKARVEEAWKAFQSPVQVAPGVWLDPQVTGAVAQPLSAVGGDLAAGLSLRAHPRVVAAATAPAVSPAPLPPLQTGIVGDSFVVALPVDLSFASATQQLQEAIHAGTGGLRYPATGEPHVVVQSAEVYGAGSTAVLRVSFTGSARGVIYLVGTPRYDPASDVIGVPDLDYSLETNHVFLKAADWLNHDGFKAELARRSRFSIRSLVATAKTEANRALTRTVGPVQVTGSLNDLRVLDVSADPAARAFRARVMFGGSLSAAVR